MSCGCSCLWISPMGMFDLDVTKENLWRWLTFTFENSRYELVSFALSQISSPCY